MKGKYEESLKYGSVEEAMQYGETYYITLKNGVFTTEDKEKVQNDILLMYRQQRK